MQESEEDRNTGQNGRMGYGEGTEQERAEYG
jgi:hypothetical protein